MLLESAFEVGSLGCRQQAGGMSRLVERPMAAATLYTVVVLEDYRKVVVAVEGIVGMARLKSKDEGAFVAVFG